MIRLLLFLTTLSLAISCEPPISSKKTKLPKKATTENQILEVRVKLVSDPDMMGKKLFHCGTMEVRQTFDFQVIRVIRGDYKNKYIPINFLCPLERIQSKFLRKNRMYRFKLKRRKMITNLNTSETSYTGDFEIASSTD